MPTKNYLVYSLEFTRTSMGSFIGLNIITYCGNLYLSARTSIEL